MARQYILKGVPAPGPSKIKPLKDRAAIKHKYAKLTSLAEARAGSAGEDAWCQAVWQLLPNSKTGLLRWLEELLQLPAGLDREQLSNPPAYWLIRQLALKKLACRLTDPNPWRLRKDAYLRGFEIQQLYPMWEAGLVHAIGLQFRRKMTPVEIADHCTTITEKVLNPLGCCMLRVIAKHRRSPTVQTSWHVHGIVWPRDKVSIATWRRRLQALRRKLVKGNYGLQTQAYIRKVRCLHKYSWYLARNLASAYTYRDHRRHQAQNSNMPIEPDAGSGVRLYAAPPMLWGQDWQRWSVGKSGLESSASMALNSPFMRQYRRELRKLALEQGKTEGDWAEKNFSENDRREVFRRTCGAMPQEKPRSPWVASPDGHIYQVIAAEPLPTEPIQYHLVRKILPADVARLPDEVRACYSAQQDILRFPVTIGDLQFLAKLAVEYATPDWAKLVDPVSGKTPPLFYGPLLFGRHFRVWADERKRRRRKGKKTASKPEPKPAQKSTPKPEQKPAAKRRWKRYF